MKANNLIATLAVIASISVFTSCGGSKTADTSQVKAYVLMSSMDKNSVEKGIDDYINTIERGKIKIKKLPDYTQEFFDEEGMPECNPVLEYARVFLRNSIAGSLYNKISWELDECSALLSDFGNYPNQSYDSWEYNCPRDLKEAKQELEKEIKWIVEGEVSPSKSYCKKLNTLLINIYRMENPAEHKAAMEEIITKYVNYIANRAEKLVKIMDWESDYGSTTKNCKGYFVTYSINKNYYVLTQIVEESKSDEFELKTLYRGTSIIDLDRKLEGYKRQ